MADTTADVRTPVPVARRTLAGDLLRQARRRRGLSQRALADAAGVSHTSVARIESGRTQPTLGTLVALLAGADFRPDVRLVNTARPSTLVARHKDALVQLARRYQVRTVQVCGSTAVGEDTSDSDLDLLVEFEPEARGIDRVEFAEAVEDLLCVSVDVVNPRSAQPAFLSRARSALKELEDF